MRKREVAAAGRCAARRDDREAERSEVAVNEREEKIGEGEGFGAQRAEAAGFGDEFERAQKRGERQDMGSADVQRGGTGGGLVVWRHGEAAVGADAPPAGEAGC